MVFQGDVFVRSISEPVTRILQVLRVCIVERSNFTLNVTVLLHGIGVIVILRRKQCDGGHAGREPTSEISRRELISGIESDLCFHPDDLIASVQDLKGLELRLLSDIRVAGGTCGTEVNPHS